MPQQRKRTKATVACINCQWRHERCERLSGEDICAKCRNHNRLCISFLGKKRGPKARCQNFMNTNQYLDQLIPSIRNGLHPVSGSMCI
ncbi:15946_t:CDS:1, partial [Dentiscutata heterogama]